AVLSSARLSQALHSQAPPGGRAEAIGSHIGAAPAERQRYAGQAPSSAQTLACLIRLFMFSVSESMKTWHQGRGMFFRAWHCPCRTRGTILRHRCPEIAVCTNKETKRMTAKPAIAYIRVSRPRQGRSGLGLEAQQAAIVVFAKAHAYRISETF